MRKIKFRVWLKKQKMMKENVSFHAGNIWTGYCWIPFNANCELMEYTGCEDKNGVEIFEGDIVKYWYRIFDGIASSTAIVKFYDGAFQLEDIDDSDNTELLYLTEDLEVIGNVWEDPELLEEL